MTSIADRFKRYESASTTRVVPRTATILRVDGKAFHTFSRFFKEREPTEPFSLEFASTMHDTAQMLMDNIQNAVIGYVQSDEISIVLNDWKRYDSQQWFDGKVQKIASVSSSMTSTFFMSTMQQKVEPDISKWRGLPVFDSRVFNVPHHEVWNYLLWRQQDAIRNSINGFARFYEPHKNLMNKNMTEARNYILAKHGKEWDDLIPLHRYGALLIGDQMPVYANFIESGEIADNVKPRVNAQLESVNE